MDWSKIKVPKVANKRLQTTQIADLDYVKFLVACELLKKSQSQGLQTAIYTYLKNTWQSQEERLTFDAAQEGVTPEELFERIATELLSPKPQKNS